MEYVILFAAALGLITISGDVRRWISSNLTDVESQRTVFTFQQLTRTLNSPPGYVCRKFIRSEFSPSNLEDMQRQYDDVCKWYHTAAASLPKQVGPLDFPKISFDDLDPPKGLTDSILNQTLQEVRQLCDDYETQREKYTQLIKLAGRGGGEDFVFFFSPILLCIALALQIAKVTAEIRLEKSSTVSD
jgi:hypothetical protein